MKRGKEREGRMEVKEGGALPWSWAREAVDSSTRRAAARHTERVILSSSGSKAHQPSWRREGGSG